MSKDIYTQYAAPTSDTEAQINYYLISSANPNQPWPDSTQSSKDALLLPGQSRTFNFSSVDGSKTSKYEFKGITFWTQNADGEMTSSVARSFTHDNAEDLDFGEASITKVSVSDDEISFVATNDDASGTGVYVCFQLTLEDTSGGNSDDNLCVARPSRLRFGTVS